MQTASTPVVMYVEKGLNKRFLIVAVVLMSAGAFIGFADVESEYAQEPLRDPFWPAGYFPEGWNTRNQQEQGEPAQDSSEWAVLEKSLQVKAISRMGGRAAAIINDQITAEGDVVELNQNGRVYRWKLQAVKPNGAIILDRLDVVTRSSGFKSGEK